MPEVEETISLQSRGGGYGSMSESEISAVNEKEEGDEGEGAKDLLADRPNGTSNFGAIMLVIKANVGSGVLAIPNAFSHAGILVGTVGLALIGIVCAHCVHVLVNCSRVLGRKMGRSHLSYPDVGEHSFKLGPDRLIRHSIKARNAVNVSLFIAQLGTCCVYILFVSQNIRLIIQKCIGDDPDSAGYKLNYPMRIQAYEVILVVILIPFVFIKNISHLAPFSMVANVACFLGLGVILYYILIHEEFQSISRLPLFKSWSELPLYLGTVIYSFEGIPIVLAVENNVKEPRAFLSFFGVFNVGMTMAVVFSITLGFYGYIEFGDEAQGSITLNLKSWFGIVVQALFSISIFVNYLIQFHLPLDIVGPTLASSRLAKLIGPNVLDNLFRAGVVFATFVVAATVDEYLNLLISLIGSVAASSLVLIFPALFEIVTFWPERHTMKYFKVVFCKDLLIMVFGIICFIFGAVIALQQLIQKLSQDYAVAMAVIVDEHLDLLISLLDSVASSALAPMFPGLLGIATYWPDTLEKVGFAAAIFRGLISPCILIITTERSIRDSKTATSI